MISPAHTCAEVSTTPFLSFFLIAILANTKLCLFVLTHFVTKFQGIQSDNHRHYYDYYNYYYALEPHYVALIS